MLCDRTNGCDGQQATAGRERNEARQAGKMRGFKQGSGGERLRAFAAVVLTLAATMPPAYGQQAGAGSNGPDKAASQLPVAPTPVPTSPTPLRSSERDYSKPFGSWIGNPINVYQPTTIPKASFENSVRLADLVKNGKIYLSLSDAIALAIENNYDIAIARYDLDIADTDILRTKTGATPLGAPSGLVTGTLGGSNSTLSTGGGPGGTTVGSGGAGSGVNGLTLTTAGAGLLPENLDPSVTGTVQFERATQPQVNTLFSGGLKALTTNTNEYNFTFNQGIVTGANLQVGFQNQRITTDNPFDTYSPQLNVGLQGYGNPALAAGRGHLDEQTVHLPGAK